MARPDFTGRWRYDADASALQIPAPDAVEFVIEHREPDFRLTRIWYQAGTSNTFSIALTVGADHAPVAHGDATLHPALHWEGDTLVFPTRIVRGDAVATNLVRYRLSDGGDTLEADERLRSDEMNYDNRWVLRRA